MNNFEHIENKQQSNCPPPRFCAFYLIDGHVELSLSSRTLAAKHDIYLIVQALYDENGRWIISDEHDHYKIQKNMWDYLHDLPTIEEIPLRETISKLNNKIEDKYGLTIASSSEIQFLALRENDNPCVDPEYLATQKYRDTNLNRAAKEEGYVVTGYKTETQWIDSLNNTAERFIPGAVAVDAKGNKWVATGYYPVNTKGLNWRLVYQFSDDVHYKDVELGIYDIDAITLVDVNGNVI
ncbi:hypothetical protein BG00_16005 [Pseudoalteromonas sp. SCSIO_11900]|uniref:hypothetical protein n=1 Tax=Pseudoalteromonas sp. SCSIO_11900 TaxID=1461766 RepID=UPI00044D7A23|nr:hypothetical protein [Pseudoalteromonas sp. SCSIO_11900]EWS96825.1 hypothetical protein BG00_16005 [Pseudoalteromonas sp. SCSIO_11900]